MCYTVSPVCHDCLIRVWHILVLVMHAVVKCDTRVGGGGGGSVSGQACLSPCTTYLFELTADFIGVSQGLPWNPKSRKKSWPLCSGQKIDRRSKFKVIA